MQDGLSFGPQHVLAVSAALFTLGVIGVLVRRGVIAILMSIEIMLNAANLAFITFARQFEHAEGQIYVFFIITLAAGEAAVGLAIAIAMYRLRESTDVDELSLLKW
jgi:NADH-quinone oxidoreductase subunit K